MSSRRVSPPSRVGGRVALLALAATLVILTGGCALISPDREAGLAYSGAFANWFYQTNAINIEAGAIQAASAEAAPDDPGLKARLRQLAITQERVNTQFAEMPPHPFWQHVHPGIVDLTSRFNKTTAHLREPDASGSIDEMIELFRAEEEHLLQAVIICYVQSGPCPPERP